MTIHTNYFRKLLYFNGSILDFIEKAKSGTSQEAPIDEDRILKKRADFFCHNAQTYILTSVFIGILYAGAMCISLPKIPGIRTEGMIPLNYNRMHYDPTGDGSTANLIFFHDLLSVTRLVIGPASALSLGIGLAFTALYLGTSLRRIARPFFD